MAGGLFVQVILLALRGTGDVLTLKTWAMQSVDSTFSAYARPTPSPEWQRPDYPPVAILVLNAAAKIGTWIDPSLEVQSRLLTVLVKLPVLLSRACLVWVLYTLVRRSGTTIESARLSAVVLWLNPALIVNGPALGYFDALCWSSGLLALLLAGRGYPAAAGALAAVATLTKPQGVFFLMVIVIASTKELRRFCRTVVGGVSMSFAVMAPFVWYSNWSSMLRGLSQNFDEDMLSAHALNFWWVVTAVARVIRYGEEVFQKPVLYLSLMRFGEETGWQPRLAAALLVIASAVWIAWSIRRTADATRLAAATALIVHVYFVFGISVHENHLIYAIPALGIAAIHVRSYRFLLAAVSLLAMLNMLAFYGFGRDFAQPERTGWFLPITTTLALAVIGLLMVHVREFLRGRRAQPPEALI